MSYRSVATPPNRSFPTLLIPALLGSLLLVACASSGPRIEPGTDSYTLRIVHINDHHSRLAPTPAQTLILDGEATQVTIGGFPRVVAAFEQLVAGSDNVLKLHAGDAITGDLYYTLFHGEADADLMNQICFDAFVVGNHEFDFGDLGLKRFLDYLSKRTWECDTPALGANIVPAAGESPLGWFSPNDYLLPHVLLERGGRQIGIIGIDVVGKTVNASSPDPGTVFLDELQTARDQVAILRAKGIDIIVLLTHIGYQNDLDLARQVDGVDIIVGGDSHSLLGDGFGAFGLSVEGPYPSVVEGPSGNRVCVVQAWQYSWVVGNLDIDFDADGRLLDCRGTPYLLLDNDFSRSGQALSGAALDRVKQIVASTPELLPIDPHPEAQAVFDFYQQQVAVFAAEQIAEVEQHICLRRIPGSHDRSRDGTPGCAEATDVHGGHVQTLVSQAFLLQGQRFGGADIVIQNGGGVRDGIAPGAFTIGSAYTALPFKNTLVRLSMSGAEIRGVLEDAIEHFLADTGANSGSYPYAANLRWHTDLTRSREQGRLVDLETHIDGQWVPLPDERMFAVISNDYIAGGRDGYFGFASIPDDRVEDTFLDYAQALVDHARSVGILARPSVEEYSTLSFRDIDGQLFAPQ